MLDDLPFRGAYAWDEELYLMLWKSKAFSPSPFCQKKPEANVCLKIRFSKEKPCNETRGRHMAWEKKREQKPLSSNEYCLILEVIKRQSYKVKCQTNLIIGSDITLEFCVCSLISRWWWYNCLRHRKETKTSPTMNLQTADFSKCSGAFFHPSKTGVAIFLKYALQDFSGSLLNISFSIIWNSEVTKECL